MINSISEYDDRVERLESYINFMMNTGTDDIQSKFIKHLHKIYKNNLANNITHICNGIQKIIEDIRKDISINAFTKITSTTYNIGGKQLQFSEINKFLQAQFIKNDGKFTKKSFKPYWTNMIGYYYKLGVEPDMNFEEEYTSQIINRIYAELSIGNEKGNNMIDDIYIDPISFEEISVDDPDAKFIFCNASVYIFHKNTLLTVLEHNFDNPITRLPFTDTELEYIRS